MRFTKKYILILLLLIPSALWAFPKPTGFVNDFAQAISQATASKLEQTLSSFEKQTGIEIAIATLPGSDGGDIDQMAVDLYQEWGIGKKGVDKGVLILLIPSERWGRIEVGYGLEGAINDAYAGRIRRDVMFPYFKKGDIDNGLIAGVSTILNRIIEVERIDFNPNLPAVTYQKKKLSGPEKIFGILLLLIAIYLFIKHPRLLLLLLFFSGGRGGGGGGGFGGGFGGFGGGLSGGGGSSGRW
ncbi:MAG: TPM domain-containing protein [Pseudomonadota bacterium]